MTHTPPSLPLPTPPKLVVVLGMHRSGTSALMGALHQLGLGLGSELLPEREDNQSGFWENQNIVSFNQSFLEHFQRDWHSVLSLPPFDPKAPSLESKAKELETLLGNEFSNARHLGVKDPRMCRTLPFWHATLRDMHLSAAYCLIVRHPFEVAASLAKRDGFTRGKSLLLWLDHVLESAIHTRTYPRLWFDYTNLLQEKSKAVRRILEAGFLPWKTLQENQERILGTFLNSSLRHHQSASFHANSQLEALCLELYERLCTQPESEATQQKIDQAHSLWKTSQGLFEEFLMDQSARFTLLQDEVANARRSHEARDQVETSLRNELARVRDLKDEKSQLHQRVQELEAEREATRQLHSDLLNQIAAAQLAHADLSQQIEIARQGHATKDAQLEEARRNIAALVAQVDEARGNIAQLEEQIQSAKNGFSILQAQLAEASKNHGIQVEMLANLSKERADLLNAAEETAATLCAKDQQIDEARSNIALLQEQLEVARKGHLEKDRQIDSARASIESLSQQIETARKIHDQKIAEIADARELNHSLQNDLSTLQARYRELRKELDHVQAGRIPQNTETLLARLHQELSQARAIHDAKDVEIAHSRTLNESLKVELAQLQNQHVHVCQQLQQLREGRQVSDSQETIAALRAELERARAIHDQKMQEIAFAREVHDAKVAEIDAARQNIAILAEQIENARRSHRARDQIEGELRKEVHRLREMLKPKPNPARDSGLTPQPEA